MSNLLVQNIKHTNNTTSMAIDTSGQVSVRGEGSATTTNLQQGLAKVWVNSAGDGASINDSLNFSSLGDDGTGQYTYNYTNNFNNDDYSSTYGTKERSGGADFLTAKTGATYSTSAQEIRCWNYLGNFGDPAHGHATLHGDLA